MNQDTLLVHIAPKKAFAGLAVALALSVAGAAHGAFYGFEDLGTGDWTAPITNCPSTGCVLPVPNSAEGIRHAELTNLPDTFATGYGFGNYSYFGLGSGPKPYAGDFFQSISVYIDTSLSSGGTAAINNAFWIDMSPSNNTTGTDFGAEHNFRLSTFGGSTAVYVDGATVSMATLTLSGWYSFGFTYELGSATVESIGVVRNDATNLVVGSTGPLASTIANADLGAEGYVWITAWMNGYSGDTLAIDCVQSGPLPLGPAACVPVAAAVPEPATMALLGLGLAALGFRRRKQA